MHKLPMIITSSLASSLLVAGLIIAVAPPRHSVSKLQTVPASSLPLVATPDAKPSVAPTPARSVAAVVATRQAVAPVVHNPLAGRKFYIDGLRDINKLLAGYTAEHNDANAVLAGKIASQPSTTWLVGPSANDPTASRDIAEVTRTSTEAALQGTVPIYELYAIPGRDGCASYSRGGFKNQQDYLSWVDRIIAALRSDAVFSVEADAIPQNIRGNCLGADVTEMRYQTLAQALLRLHQAPRVLGAYLDAGHSEWFSDPAVLVEPLRKAGIDHARGIAVNVSNFVSTGESVTWSQSVLRLLGGDKGAIIDTGRNGNGTPPASVTGEGRWCNPSGRAIGPVPTTAVRNAGIDAFFWGKNIGESDGSCSGFPAAGVFVPNYALDLARNAAEQQ